MPSLDTSNVSYDRKDNESDAFCEASCSIQLFRIDRMHICKNNSKRMAPSTTYYQTNLIQDRFIAQDRIDIDNVDI